MNNKLQEIRKEKHLSREKLEVLSGVPARAIKAYESGQVSLEKASFISIIKLSKALDVEPLALFGGDLP